MSETFNPFDSGTYVPENTIQPQQPVQEEPVNEPVQQEAQAPTELEKVVIPDEPIAENVKSIEQAPAFEWKETHRAPATWVSSALWGLRGRGWEST